MKIKKFYLFIFIPVILFSCKKEQKIIITGTVVSIGGCFQPNSWLVLINNPDFKKHNYICNDTLQPTGYSCKNAAYIKNLPQQFASAGNKIKFSKWTYSVSLCSSNSYSPRDLEVSDLSEQ